MITLDYLKTIPEIVIRYSLDLACTDKRIRAIANYVPINPMTMIKEINEIERLTEYKRLLLLAGARQDIAQWLTDNNYAG